MVMPIFYNVLNDTFLLYFFSYIYNLPMVLFGMGLLGIVVTRKHLLMLLISIEIILLAINLNVIYTSTFFDDVSGQIFALFILTIAAAESAIGLALLVVFYRLRGFIAIDFINNLKG